MPRVNYERVAAGIGAIALLFDDLHNVVDIFSSFNFDSASANTAVVQASRSFLNLPSVRARSLP